MTKKQEAVVNYLVGQAMKQMPRADPRVLRELVIESLEARAGFGPKPANPAPKSEGPHTP